MEAGVLQILISHGFLLSKNCGEQKSENNTETNTFHVRCLSLRLARIARDEVCSST